VTLRPDRILPTVIDAVTEAGAIVAAEFSRPGGPRFSDHVTAPVDHEIELILRHRLMALVPARFVGEEAGVVAAESNGLCWVVDPHDGTRAFLEGRRGSAVSVALLRHGTPVLGVVYAPLSPDRGPDLIAWAEGAGPVTRNGAPVSVDLRRRYLTDNDVVFLNHGAWQRPIWHSTACAPARFMPLPSIAYRLARIAVGDGIATQTLRPVNALDIAAGHALLLAAGGVLVTEDGAPVTYSELGESRPSACFGGAPEAVAVLRSRKWRGSTEDRRPVRVTLHWPRAAEGLALDRAIGCLLGLVAGDVLDGYAATAAGEGESVQPADLRGALKANISRGTIAGQPGAGAEQALLLARALAGRRVAEEAERAGAADDDASRAVAVCFDGGHGLPGSAGDQEAFDAGVGLVLRVVPIGLWANGARTAAQEAMKDAGCDHAGADVRVACAAVVAAIAAGISGANRAEMIRAALDVAPDGAEDGASVRAALVAAETGGATPSFPSSSHLILAPLHNAFACLAQGLDTETALIRSASRGGGMAGRAALAGALLGAAGGRRTMPMRWIIPILTCRPDAGLAVVRPRPDAAWPDDLVDLAEALLLSRQELS